MQWVGVIIFEIRNVGRYFILIHQARVAKHWQINAHKAKNCRFLNTKTEILAEMILGKDGFSVYTLGDLNIYNLSGLYFLMIQVMNKCLDVSQRGQQKTRFSLDGILFMAITSKLSDKKKGWGFIEAAHYYVLLLLLLPLHRLVKAISGLEPVLRTVSRMCEANNSSSTPVSCFLGMHICGLLCSSA